MLYSNEIARSYDHQYLCKESINIFDFLHGDAHRGKDPVGIYLRKVNNRNTITRCEICSKLTIKTPEQCQWRQWTTFCFLKKLYMKKASGLQLSFKIL